MRYPNMAYVLPLLISVYAVQPNPAFADESYSIKRVFTVGETDRYRSVISAQIDNPDGGVINYEMMLDTTETTTKQNDDGSVVVKTTLDQAASRMGEGLNPLPGVGLSMTTTYDKNGKVTKQELETNTVVVKDKDGKETTRNGGSGAVTRIAGLLPFTRPVFNLDKLIKPGEQWTFDILVGDAKDQKITGKFRMVGLVQRLADVPYETLKVQGAGDGIAPADGGGQKVRVDVTFFIEPGTGKSLKTDGSITTFAKQTDKPTKVSFKRVRLPALPTSAGGNRPAR